MPRWSSHEIWMEELYYYSSPLHLYCGFLLESTGQGDSVPPPIAKSLLWWKRIQWTLNPLHSIHRTSHKSVHQRTWRTHQTQQFGYTWTDLQLNLQSQFLPPKMKFSEKLFLNQQITSHICRNSTSCVATGVFLMHQYICMRLRLKQNGQI